MANCHESLLKFSEALNIAQTIKTKLASANKTVRAHIKKECKANGYPLRRFKVQGSKQLGTLIRRYGKESDIDIGVYFYPKPEIEPESLIKAMHRFFEKGHATQTQPGKKTKCVRVHYAGTFHIDLPIYYLESLQGKGKSYLATRREGWVKSDPREFEDWFIKQGGKNRPQLVRIVRYLKAWSHHVADEKQIPKGVALTVMAGQLYKPYLRDDEALLQVLKGIDKTLSENWSCQMPVVPKDELLKRFSKTDKDHFMRQLSLFIIDAQKALKSRSQLNACVIWKKHLGRHFQLPT